MKKYKILLVDNNKQSFDYFNEVIGSKYDIELIKKVENVKNIVLSKNKPDLILLNTSVIGKDVYELGQSLKRDAMTSEVPLIFIVEHSDKDGIK
ncbi:MAG: hypothetical protein PF437_07860, partial [Sulfurimonas sp.]|nr:hypothetical protein [Sulfurimonas sp.]